MQLSPTYHLPFMIVLIEKVTTLLILLPNLCITPTVACTNSPETKQQLATLFQSVLCHAAADVQGLKVPFDQAVRFGSD